MPAMSRRRQRIFGGACSAQSRSDGAAKGAARKEARFPAGQRDGLLEDLL
jgi:hypothetical protein